MNTTHSELIIKAKSMFPNMPNEVFTAWLSPIISHHNTWPYANVFSPHPTDQWGNYFRSFTISNISNCLWHLNTVTLDMNCLDPTSNRTIETLIENHVHNFDATGSFNVRNSESRFFGFVEHIKRTGRIPTPIIGINTEDGLGILDGNHRLAALKYVGINEPIPCETWIGVPDIK